ncbi:PDZ domain-containing protein 8 isoform X2 [Anabrus simplex]|uniref:PDZ domain-containing protein 8 isoform X2 n=1 Tax=Anabrus simplex TaxID=316456 RepID=UPI0035A344FB
MDFILLLFIIVVSVLLGILATLATQWYLFNHHLMKIPYVGPPEKPMLGQFRLPQSLTEALQSSDIPKKESCLALNLLFQFLFKELRHAQKVRRWFRWKLSLEFEELLTRTTTGKLFDSVSVRDLHLGTQFPTIKNITVRDVVLNAEHQHVDSFDLCLDLEYSGGFQLAIDANMVLGKMAYLAVKVNNLSGLARLQFTRLPYTHWSFSFYNDPVLELQVESQFQGRPLPQITSLIINQIRKSLKKKHTLPNYKLRYKPFFTKSLPGEEEEDYSIQNVCAGTLQVTIIEVTRLMENSAVGNVYCSLAVDSTAWVEVVHSDTSSYITVDLTITKTASQQLGIVFKQEFVAERYQACVVVETVIPQSPAGIADVRKSDVLVAVDGKRVTSLSQAARLIKAAGEKFAVRIERKANYRIQRNDNTNDKDIVSEKDGEPEAQASAPGSPVLRHRKVSEDKTESDSSSSSPASLPGSPAKRPSLFSRSNQPTPEHKSKLPSPTNVGELTEKDLESAQDYLQIHKTKELLFNQVLVFEETLNFKIHSKLRYLNVSVWSKGSGNDNTTTASKSKLVPGQPNRIERDTLLGHVSIPLAAIASECSATKLGHHLKSYSLLPPDPYTAISRNHKLSTHSGFEPCLCYGDILLSFVYLTPAGAPPSAKVASSPVESTPSPQLLSPTIQLEQKKQHDFIRTQFHRTTQCEFCAKKIWLKDAVQCRDCAMTCHKKCVTKCQGGTVCMPGGIQRRASALSEDVGSRTSELAVPVTQPRRASAQPEIIMTAAEDDNSVSQGPRRGISSLLATVASAAHARGLKRAGSANNLALPASANSSHLSRSLPPSPQRSPTASRKASLVGNPFHFPHSLLDNDSGDDVSAALDHLLQHPNDEDLMSVAKSTGKELYCNLSLPERKDKINKMIGKLKAAIDAETQSRMALAREEQETKDPTTHTKIAFLIGKSDEKVQALAVLMLHFCAGLQHTQDLEDTAKRDAETVQSEDTSPE